MSDPHAQQVMREVVVPVVERSISTAGFRHARSRFVFQRRLNGTLQTVHLGPDVGPRYDPGSLIVLQPTMRIEFDPISSYLSRDEVSGSGAAVVQPIAYGGTRKQWAIQIAEDAPAVASALGNELRSRIMQLLDDLDSPSGLVRAYEIHDSRVLWLEQTYAAVIVALAMQGDGSGANKVATQRFRGDALTMVFPRVARLLEGDATSVG